ncbi:MAG TPA: hypothetical protein VMX16_07705 [Terriglobia bacterium]|nr:hypothetical protein [Terriglobia bacterium]
MVEPKVPGPPPRYASTEELEKISMGAIPALATQFLSLFGKRTPRITRKQKARLRLHLSASRPYLLGLGALEGQLDAKQSQYALREGLLREQFKVGGKTVPKSTDAFAFLLGQAERFARPNRYLQNIPAYSAVRGDLEKFAARLVQALPRPTLEQALNEWHRSAGAKRFVHFIGQWPTLSRKFLGRPPNRLTTKAASELANEYKVSGAFFEQCLRLLAYLASVTPSEPSSWPAFEKKNLSELMELAKLNDQINFVGRLIDRHVRNALAHGVPQLVPDSQQALFDDRGKGVTWTLQEFFENTRRLTLAVCAMTEFYPILHLQLTRCRVMSLWAAAQTSC